LKSVNEALDGYPVARNYYATVQPQMAPVKIDLAFLARSRLPPLREKGFRYAELGCGRGTTLVALAALHPDGHFLGVDMLPAHVAWARRLAGEVGIDNITFEEADFATLATHGPPAARFDYVSLHGVYTWISDANRAHVNSILGDWVTAGGAVYVSCNAMPAWAEAAPIRRIYQDVLDADAPSLEGMAAARSAVELWLEHEASSPLKKWWERLSALSDTYLLHELGAKHAGALWSSELREAMARARLDYVGPSLLVDHFDKLRLDASARDVINKAEVAGFGPTARDLTLNRSFLTEVFSRGAPHLAQSEVERLFGGMRIQGVDDDARVKAFETSAGLKSSLDESVAERLEGVLREGPCTIGELAARTNMHLKKAIQAILILIATQRARSLCTEAETLRAADRAARFNEVARRRHEDGVPLPGVVSAARGAIVQLSAQERERCFGADREAADAALSELVA
jgi:SAM-dependent methyltransferase